MSVAIRHIGLVVSDLHKALEFWCGVLNFKVVTRMNESGQSLDSMMGLINVNVTTVKLNAPDGGMLELLRFHSHPDADEWCGVPFSTGLTHIALTVKDIDAVVESMRDFGCEISNHPQVSPDGKVKVIYAQGPERVLLELVEMIG